MLISAICQSLNPKIWLHLHNFPFLTLLAAQGLIIAPSPHRARESGQYSLKSQLCPLVAGACYNKFLQVRASTCRGPHETRRERKEKRNKPKKRKKKKSFKHPVEINWACSVPLCFSDVCVQAGRRRQRGVWGIATEQEWERVSGDQRHGLSSSGMAGRMEEGQWSGSRHHQPI